MTILRPLSFFLVALFAKIALLGAPCHAESMDKAFLLTTTKRTEMGERDPVIAQAEEEGPMSFNILKGNHPHCPYFDPRDVLVDDENTYLRRGTWPTPCDEDFKTHWERDEWRRVEHTACRDIIADKGLSVDLRNHAAQELIEECKKKYDTAPQKSARYIHQFKLHKTTGVVDKLGTNKKPNHRHIWKSDTFSVDRLVKGETIDLANV